MVVLTPVGSYYGDQLKPIRIYVEDEYVRAVTGGVGDVKTSGNYAAYRLSGKPKNWGMIRCFGSTGWKRNMPKR